MFKVGDIVQPSNQTFENYWMKTTILWLARVEGHTDFGKIRIEWIAGPTSIIGVKADHRPDKFRLHMNGVERMIQVL
jgi:hypothetical protein